jgi:hypothetical protein
MGRTTLSTWLVMLVVSGFAGKRQGRVRANRSPNALFLGDAHRANFAARRGIDGVPRCRTHADEERRN